MALVAAREPQPGDALTEALRAGTLDEWVRERVGTDDTSVVAAYDRCLSTITQARDPALVAATARQLAALCVHPDFKPSVPESVMLRLRHVICSVAAPAALHAALYVFFGIYRHAVDTDYDIWRDDAALHAVVKRCLAHFSAALAATAAVDGSGGDGGSGATAATAPRPPHRPNRSGGTTAAAAAAAAAATAASAGNVEAALSLAEAAAMALTQPEVQALLLKDPEQLATAAAAQATLLRYKPSSAAAFGALLALLTVSKTGAGGGAAVSGGGGGGGKAPPDTGDGADLQQRVSTAALRHGGVEALLGVLEVAFGELRRRVSGEGGADGSGGRCSSAASDGASAQVSPSEGTAAGSSSGDGDGSGSICGSGDVSDPGMDLDRDEGGSSSHQGCGDPDEPGQPNSLVGGRWYGCYIPDECSQLQLALTGLLELLTACALPALRSSPSDRSTGHPQADSPANGRSGGTDCGGATDPGAAAAAAVAAAAAAAAACEAAEQNAEGSRVLLEALRLLAPLQDLWEEEHNRAGGGGFGGGFGGGGGGCGGLPPGGLALMITLLYGASAPATRAGLLARLEQHLSPPPSPPSRRCRTQEPAAREEARRAPVHLEQQARHQAAVQDVPGACAAPERPQRPPQEAQHAQHADQPQLLRDALLRAAEPLLRQGQVALPAPVLQLLLQLLCRAVDCRTGTEAVYDSKVTDGKHGRPAPGAWLSALAGKCPVVLSLALVLAGDGGGGSVGAAAAAAATAASVRPGHDQLLLLPVAVQLLLPALQGLERLSPPQRRTWLVRRLPNASLELLLATPAALARRALEQDSFAKLPEDVQLLVLELLSKWLVVLEPLVMDDAVKAAELHSRLSSLSDVGVKAFALRQSRLECSRVPVQDVWLFTLTRRIVSAVLSAVAPAPAPAPTNAPATVPATGPAGAAAGVNTNSVVRSVKEIKGKTRGYTAAAAKRQSDGAVEPSPSRRRRKSQSPSERLGGATRGTGGSSGAGAAAAAAAAAGPSSARCIRTRSVLRSSRDAANGDNRPEDSLADAAAGTGPGAAAGAAAGTAAGAYPAPALIGALSLARTALQAAAAAVGGGGGGASGVVAAARPPPPPSPAVASDQLECLQVALDASTLFWRGGQDGPVGGGGGVFKAGIPVNVAPETSLLMEATSRGINAVCELLLACSQPRDEMATAEAAEAAEALPPPPLAEAQRLSALRSISAATLAVAQYEQVRREVVAPAAGGSTPPPPPSLASPASAVGGAAAAGAVGALPPAPTEAAAGALGAQKFGRLVLSSEAFKQVAPSYPPTPSSAAASWRRTDEALAAGGAPASKRSRVREDAPEVTVKEEPLDLT